MSVQLSLSDTLPLPRPPILARSLVATGDEGWGAGCDKALPRTKPGEILNVINKSPDAAMAYCVARDDATGQLREGWLPAVSMTELGLDAEGVPPNARLSLSEQLKRTTIVRVEEDWHNPGEPSTLAISAGDLLSLSSERNGWALGFPLDRPERQGWLPLAFVRKLDSSVLALASENEPELTERARADLVDLLKETPPPPPMQWSWEGELPAVVSESAQRFEREWREERAQMEAQQAHAAAAAAASAAADGGPADGLLAPNRDPLEELFMEENLPEEAYPLAVCKTQFTPPRNSPAQGVLLPLLLGDLVRVTSLLDAGMCHGFLDGKPARRGWFPRKNVNVIDDPLDPRASDSAPVQLGPLPLPSVPPHLRRAG